MTDDTSAHHDDDSSSNISDDTFPSNNASECPTVSDEEVVGNCDCSYPTSPFCCGGTVTLSRPFEVYYRLDSESDPRAIKFPDPNESTIDLLIGSCKEASFGRGNKEVIDPEYRSALCLLREHFVTNFDIEDTDILDHVERTLAPNVDIVCTLDKLNIYRKDGFFKSHRDTPVDQKMFGTLVICLQTDFTGGELLVKHRGSTNTFSWEGHSTATEPWIKWCALYSDCEHEILPVTEGNRVTLAYTLLERKDRLVKNPSTALSVANASVKNPYLNLLKGLVIQAKNKGKTRLGFILQHGYVGNNTLYKGDDNLLFVAARHLGLGIERTWMSEMERQFEGYYGPKTMILGNFKHGEKNGRRDEGAIELKDYYDERDNIIRYEFIDFLEDHFQGEISEDVLWVNRQDWRMNAPRKVEQPNVHSHWFIEEFGNTPSYDLVYAMQCLLLTF